MLLNYFSRSSSSSKPAPSLSNDSSLPESDVSGSDHATVEVPEKNLDGRLVLEPYQHWKFVFPPSKFGVQSKSIYVR